MKKQYIKPECDWAETMSDIIMTATSIGLSNDTVDPEDALGKEDDFDFYEW